MIAAAGIRFRVLGGEVALLRRSAAGVPKRTATQTQPSIADVD